MTAKQIAALRERFGKLLDVEQEIRDARAWLEGIHTGRPPKNFGRFVWNWCRTSEERRLKRMAQTARPCAPRSAAVLARENPPLSRLQLESIANDERESEAMRSLAREQLADLAAGTLF